MLVCSSLATLSIWLALDQKSVAASGPPVPPDIIVYHNLSYRDGPSRQWKLDLARKRDLHGRPRPGIVVIHGGGWIEGDKSSFASREHRVPGNIVDFAALGFVAVTINYRLAGEAPFPAALEDCKNAVRWLRAHARDYNLDPDRIGAFGNSAGGHLALLLGMVDKDAHLKGDGPYQDQSSLVQAVVSDSGPIDLVEQYRLGALRQVCDRFMGGPPEGDRAAAYRRASPAKWITPATPPLLLIYGVLDNQVPVETADRFVLALGRAGRKDVSYHRLAHVDHCPYSLIRVPTMRPVVEQFFLHTLMQTPTTVRRSDTQPTTPGHLPATIHRSDESLCNPMARKRSPAPMLLTFSLHNFVRNMRNMRSMGSMAVMLDEVGCDSRMARRPVAMLSKRQPTVRRAMNARRSLAEVSHRGPRALEGRADGRTG